MHASSAQARPVLHGYRHSIYSWIVRLTLAEKGQDWDWVEVNPFADPQAARARHPFARVPVLLHDGLSLYETAAIAAYVDEALSGPPLQPADPRARARMRQIIGLADSYAYWPLVRQVYAHKVFPMREEGREGDKAEARAGLTAARPVLDALEAIVASGQAPGPWLVSETPTLADLHLAPMVAAFAEAPQGGALLAGRRRMAAWMEAMRARPAFQATTPWAARRGPLGAGR